MTALNKSVKFVGVKQGSPALPAFDLRGTMGNVTNRGKAGEAFALPLQNLMIGCIDPAEAGRAGV